MHGKVFGVLAVAMVAAMVAFACGGDEAAPTATAAPAVATTAPPPTVAPAAKVVKVGALGPFTGPLAAFGRPMLVTAEILADEYNAEGGILAGGERYKIEVLEGETKCELVLGMSAAEKVAADGAELLMLMGECGPDVTVVPWATPKEILTVSNTWTVEILDKAYPYSFGIEPTPLETMPTVWRFMKERHPADKRVFQLGLNLKSSQLAAEWSRAAMDEVGGYEWLGEAYYEAGITDFTPIVSGALAKKPDIIEIILSIEDTPALIRTIRELGFDGPLPSPQFGINVEDIVRGLEGVEQYGNNVYVVEYDYYPRPAGLTRLRDEYVKREGEWLGFVVGAYWNPLSMFEGLKAAGTVDDIPAIARAMEGMCITSDLYPGDPEVCFGGTQKYGQKHQLPQPAGLNGLEDGVAVSYDLIVPTVP